MRLAAATLAAAMLGLGTSASGANAQVAVRAVSVHLFLTPSGELSEDVAALSAFSSWNFRPAVAVRPADGEFHSYLVKVHLVADRSVFSKGTLGLVEVRSAKSGRRLYHSALANIHVPAEGCAMVARLVEGHVCEPVDITAQVGRQRITKRLNFECEE